MGQSAMRYVRAPQGVVDCSQQFEPNHCHHSDSVRGHLYSANSEPATGRRLIGPRESCRSIGGWYRQRREVDVKVRNPLAIPNRLASGLCASNGLSLFGSRLARWCSLHHRLWARHRHPTFMSFHCLSMELQVGSATSPSFVLPKRPLQTLCSANFSSATPVQVSPESTGALIRPMFWTPDSARRHRHS